MGTSGEDDKKKQPDRQVDGNEAAMFQMESPHQGLGRRVIYTAFLIEI